MTSRSPARISERSRLTQLSELRTKSASRGSVVQCAPSADHGRSSRIDPPPLVYVPGTCGLRFGEVAPSHVGGISIWTICVCRSPGRRRWWMGRLSWGSPKNRKVRGGLAYVRRQPSRTGRSGHAGLPALQGWLHGATNVRGGGGQMRLPKNSRLWAKCGQGRGFPHLRYRLDMLPDLRFTYGA